MMLESFGHGLNLSHSISHGAHKVRREKSKNSVISRRGVGSWPYGPEAVGSARGRVNVSN